MHGKLTAVTLMDLDAECHVRVQVSDEMYDAVIRLERARRVQDNELTRGWSRLDGALGGYGYGRHEHVTRVRVRRTNGEDRREGRRQMSRLELDAAHAGCHDRR